MVCKLKRALKQRSVFVLMCLSTIPSPPGERGGLGGVPLFRLRPRLVFMLPWPDHSASGAALHQAFCGRCLYFTHPQEPEERILEEDSTPGAGYPCLQLRAPQIPQSRLRRSPKLQWRRLQAQRAGEWHQPARERWKWEWEWSGHQCGKRRSHVRGKRVSF